MGRLGLLQGLSALLLFALTGTRAVDVSAVRVNAVNPQRGSLNGATRITISGQGFSEDQFNFGEGRDKLGNRVKLVSGTRSYVCDLHQDGNTKTQITCDTRAMVADDYYVRISVDGEEVPEANHCKSLFHKDCRFSAESGATPTITSLGRLSDIPGKVQTMNGKIWTSAFGSNIESTNGRTPRILRLYAGGQLCDPKKDDGVDLPDVNDELYGIALDSDGTSDSGYMKCKMAGSYVGNSNFSFIIEGAYGRSNPADSTFRVTAEDRITMFQSYAEIYNITPSTGSEEGGTRLTIKGKFFDQTDAPAKIVIGDTSCKVESVQDNVIYCKTLPKTVNYSSIDQYPGNRGGDFGIYTNSTLLNDFLTVATYNETIENGTFIDELQWNELNFEEEIDNYMARMRAFFIPPRNGSYRFNIVKSDDESTLYFSETGQMSNLTQVAFLDSKKKGLYSQKFNLEGKKPYPLVHVTRESRSSAYGTVAVHMSSTSLPGGRVTSNVRSEIQDIYTTSTVHNEVQVVRLDGWTSQSRKKEVQRVSVVSDNPADASFRIGWGGVWTAPITGATPASTVKTELNALPSITPSSVTVSQGSISGGIKFDITFDSELGDVDMLTAKLDKLTNRASATLKVEERTKGKPDMSHFALKFMDATSQPISVKASLSDVQEAVQTLFEVRCPDFLSNPRTRIAFQLDYESDKVYWESGRRVTDVEPFCGGTSIKNPRWLYREHKNYRTVKINLLSTGKVCFAYMGKLRQLIYVAHNYKTQTQSQARYRGDSFTVTIPEAASWNYICIDLKILLEARHTGLTEVLVSSIFIFKDTTTADPIYIDNIIVVTDNPTTDVAGVAEFRRLPPPMWMLEAVSVTGNTTWGYRLDMTLRDCPYNLPLFTIAGGQVSSSKRGQSAEYSSNTWKKGASVTVQRELAATPPIKGKFRVTVGSGQLDLTAEVEAQELKLQLQTLPGVGDVDVVRAGTCAGYTWRVTWATAPGDQELIIMNGASLTGYEVTSGIRQIQDGGVYFNPIPGDLLRTFNDNQQVQVDINKIPSRCRGDCSFTWTPEATPSIASITPTSGSNTAGTVLTLAGQGFSSTTSENQVVIGGEPCTVSSATSTEIRCTVGQGPAGAQDVVVNIDQKGLARNTNGVLQFNYGFAITAISPSQGSVAGGMLLTITGTGFGANITATVGGGACIVLTAAYSSLTCRTPPGSAGAAAVAVTDGTSSDTAGSQFTYSTADTPVIASINQNTFQVQAGQTITISGTGFGSSAGSVSISGAAATIVSYTDTEIQATMPLLPPGAYPLIVNAPGKGNADSTTNSIGQLTYDLRVTNVFPRSGSMEGGSIVTVTGTGFPTDTTQVTVTINGQDCAVSGSASTQLTCTAPSSGTLHTITNNGVHPTHGKSYAWSSLTLDVLVGDTVKWTWAAPERTTSEYSVQETDSPSGITAKVDGFSSGAKRTKGAFQYQFTTAGAYYYWSGHVDQADTIEMRGVITVQERLASSVAIEMKVNGYSAIYDTSSGVTDPTNSASCSPTYSPVSGCNEPSPSSSGSGFEFEYLKCKTPTVSSISPNQGSASDTITIDGSGFGGTSCQNMVMIGDKFCNISSSSKTRLRCSIDVGGNAVVGIPTQVSVSVANIGQALITENSDIKRYFVLLPHISSISPTGGSRKGGTEVTIKGSGFYGQVTVAVGSVSCVISSLSYTQINCVTDTALEGKDTLSVKVLSNGQNVDALCQASSCKFSFSSSLTPTVTSISPDTIASNDTELAISGKGFGNSISDVNVTMGGETCQITSMTDRAIRCVIDTPVAGVHPVLVVLAGQGSADATGVTLTVNGIVSSVQPVSGSIQGGNMLSLKGVGFKQGDTTVYIGSQLCSQLDVKSNEVKCKAPAGSAGAVKIQVLANSVRFPKADYAYAQSDTPTLTSLSTTSGKSGDTVTLTGTGFSSNTLDMEVTIDGVQCAVNSASSTDVTCTLGIHSAGQYPVVVTHADRGIANTSLQFTYTLTVTSVTPSQGSYGGGQTVTVAGIGFDSTNTNVTVCGQPCIITGSTTPTQLTCTTPAKAITGATQACDVTAAVADQESTAASSFTYSQSLTPTIANVSPRRAGTGGGTSLTVTGTGFGTNSAQVNVEIAGKTCVLVTVTDTEVVCTTASRKPSIQTKIQLSIGTNGIATQDQADFEYIDVWSSQFTWNYSMPVKGDFVVIPSDMTVLLDTDTPVLKMLLINGGKLIFDEQNVELQAENILITNGGLLQVGTESAPFQSKAIITLHGNPRSQELPIYGTKTIAVREGTVDLHGKPPSHSWTLLGATVEAGQSQITLKEPVDWKVGDYIAIGSTGDHQSQKENEMRQITAVSNGGLTLTLHAPVDYQHLGERIDLGSGFSLDAFCPIGLLTRNILIRGSNNVQWADQIAACPDGFNTGEFATQTCFQGRFGEETGSDQYGAQMMFHPARPDEGLVTGRIENIEMTYAGQAFRLGRYAIHFHLNGDMSDSFVKGCAIHHSFNRAVNIHGTNYVTIFNNVVFDILGGAVFLEDGIEIGNVFDSNLAIFVKGSSSLQNDDITPAAFWLTNPNNTVVNNVAAGGTHFGFWYRMHHHPDGPSYDPNYCPQHIPMGTFSNNTVISHGWFGLWMFQQYFPMEGGGCSSSTPIAAKWHSLTAWNNEKGAEWVSGGALQFHDFFLVNNKLAGIEMKLMSHSIPFSEDRGAMLKGCTIISRPITPGKMVSSTTRTAIVTPYARGLLIKDMTFVNFDTAATVVFGVASVQGKTQEDNGGFTYRTSGLTFHNSPNKIAWRWIHEAVYHDLDGTLTGIVNGKAVPTSLILPNDKCSHTVAGMSVNSAVPGSVCQADVDFTRFSYNNAVPESLVSKNVSFTNAHGTTIAQYKVKRVTHKPGWMVLLVTNSAYIMEFVNAIQITNISYTGTFYDLRTDEYIILKHNLTQRPHHFGMVPGQSINASSAMVSYAANDNGAWYFDTANTMVSYLLSGKTGSSRRKKREISPPETGSVDRDVQFTVYRCSNEDCVGPIDPNMVPPPTTRPDNALFWSNVETWKDTEANWGGNYGDGTFGLPKDGDDVKIPAGAYVVADIPLPVMGKLYIHGTLELEYMPDSDGLIRDFTLNCTHIFINGGRLVVGWEDNRYIGNTQIVLRGDHLTPDIPLPSGPNMGSKVLGVFGGLELHGIERAVTWTRLSLTGSKGSNSITVEEAVDWVVGEEIVIAPTGYSSWEVELMKITAVSIDKRTLTLNGTLNYNHLVTRTDVGQGRTVTFAAEVGLLTRNIKIIGAPYDKMYSQAFGARVLVGTYNNDGTAYTGYARLSNVEFYHTGQEGWTDEYDPRFSIAYLDLGDVTEVRPSSVRKCSFHHGFAPAIGTFGTNNMNITDNVIYHTVGSSIQDSGIDNAFRRNLVTMMVFPGTFNGRDEGRLFWDAGFDIRRATRPIITGNAVAGSERAGYRVDGEPCDGSTEQWADNTAHSVLIGVEMLPEDGLTTCSQLGNFTVYKAWDIGIYFQVPSGGVKVVGLVSADNTLGIYPMIIGPSATSHAFANKYVDIKESIMIGKTADFDCSNDKMTDADRNIYWSKNSRPWRSSSGGVVGIAVTTFSTGSNNAPIKPFTNIMAYQAIGGLTTTTGTTFVGFQSKCTGKKDVILTTSPRNDDTQHPVKLQAISFKDVDADNKVYFHRPNAGKVNPAACVDMDCDGMKKIIVEDMDGTFLAAGGKGTLIPQSEFEWNGDSRRGLGDYRIPKTLLTDTSGNRIAVSTIAPQKGIIRDDTCVYKAPWQAYECHGLDYALLTLESMDSDTETRRLSPIAIVGDGYLDLVNGPQDHGWCLGYTCQKRLSTFPIVVATGKYYILHYTGTSPQHTRLRLLNSVNSQAFVIGIFYAIPQRLDVYIDDVYIEATNTVQNANGYQVAMAPTYSGQYIPDVTTGAAGTNYFEKSLNTLHVLVRGPTLVEIRTSSLIVIGFELPAMTVDDFYGANLVFNLATFLDIPASKIKVAKAVSEIKSRRKRETVFKVELEISNPPSNQTNTTTPDPDAFSYDQLQNMSSAIINYVQLGTFGSLLNVTILELTITEPVPAPDTSAWQTVVSTSAEGKSYSFKIQIPQTLSVETEPVGLSEGNVLSVHPVLKFLDRNGAIVQQLGAKTAPWQVVATLVKVNASSQDTALSGNTTADFVLGYANYTSVVVDYSGTYRLDYRISYPPEAEALFTAQSAEFYVADRALAMSVIRQDNETTVGQAFSVVAEIVDAITAVKVDNIAWKNHTWMCTASLYMPGLYTGQLEGTLIVPVDPSTGLAHFSDLRVTSQGRYYLKLVAVSTPAFYTLEGITGLVDARPVGWVQPVVEVSKVVKLRFNVNYNSTLSNGRTVYLEAGIMNQVYASFTEDNVTLGSITFEEGSIMASFVIEGSTAAVTRAIDSLHQVVSSGTFRVTFFGQTLTADTLMWVDGTERAVPVPTNPGVSAGIIAAIVSCCLVVLIVTLVALVLLKMKLNNNKKIGSEHEMRDHQPLVHGGNVEAQSNLSNDIAPAAVTTGRQLYPDRVLAESTSPSHTLPTSLQRRKSEGIQEISLDTSNVTKQIPIAEVASDEDEPQPGPTTGRSDGSDSTAGSTTGSRPGYRPPTKPSLVWDAPQITGPTAKSVNPFPDIGKNSPYTIKLTSALRKGAIAGKLASLTDRRDVMPKKKKKKVKKSECNTGLLNDSGATEDTLNTTHHSAGTSPYENPDTPLV